MNNSNNQNNNTGLPKLEDVVDDIQRVMDETGLTAAELTIREYSKAGGSYDGRKLRRLGGFASILNHAFKQDLGTDFKTQRIMARRRLYTNKLERQLGDWHALQDEFLDSFKRVLEETGTVEISKLDKPELSPKKEKVRANNVMISDIHLGLRIDPSEVMTNGYDWTIGARRLGKLTDQVARYKLDHRDECSELNVLLGGDLGQGIIHLNDAGTDLITYQVVGISKYITQMIDTWRHYYTKINVYCTPDNHMRLPHKGPDRATAQKHDSFSTMVHFNIAQAFRDVPDVKVVIPKTAITTFDVLGHKVGLTHGDGHVSTGNVGNTINVKSVTDRILRLNASVEDGKKYDAMVLGHVHVALNMMLNETGTELIVNGTGSGTDPYAETLGFFKTAAIQVMWESTKDYVVGDFRKVNLRDADEKPEYERFITPYDYGYTVTQSKTVAQNKK